MAGSPTDHYGQTGPVNLMPLEVGQEEREVNHAYYHLVGLPRIKRSGVITLLSSTCSWRGIVWDFSLRLHILTQIS